VLAGATLCAGCATGVTGDPYQVAGTKASVFGSVVTNSGGQVEYWVEYGATTAYGSQSEHDTVTLQQNASQAVLVSFAGLQRSTTYHYRVCAQDSQQTGGPGCGADNQFTTPNVDCGDVITTDFQLSGDLDCGGANGPVVGADGIDINLGGHQIRAGSFALDNRGGFDDVTMRGGSLYAIGIALALDGASRNSINHVSAGLIQNPFVGPSTETGVRIQGGEANAVRNSNLAAAGTALSVTDSPGLLMADSTALASDGSRGGGPAVSLHGDLARVVRNDLRANVAITGSSNRVVGNHVSALGYGIGVFEGHANVVAENEVRVSMFPFGSFDGDGILVEADAVDTRLRANVTNSNEDDGIDVRSATTRLKDNHADDNGDFGIDAVAGVIDLGGNTASGNGNPLQCRNVFCGATSG
jgi:hypothetical protein